MKRLKCSSATAQVSVPPLSPRSGRDLIFYRVPRPEISAIAPLAGWGWRNVVSRTSRVLVRVNFEFGIREVIREEGKRDFSPCCCVREQLKKLALSSDRDHRSIRWMSEWGRSEEAEGMMRAQGRAYERKRKKNRVQMKDTVWELRQARHRSTESTVLSFIGWNMDRERNVSRKGRRQENALSHEVWKALKTLPKSTVSREARRGTSKESNVVYFVRREERPPRTMRTLIGMEESEFANPRQLRREERFSGGKYGRQADGWASYLVSSVLLHPRKRGSKNFSVNGVSRGK